MQKATETEETCLIGHIFINGGTSIGERQAPANQLPPGYAVG